MNDPNPGKTETLLRKSSWAGFVIGAGFVILPAIYEMRRAKLVDHLNTLRPEEAVDGTYVAILRDLMELDNNRLLGVFLGYWRAGGLALILVGLGCSLYANKLRKKRTGG